MKSLSLNTEEGPPDFERSFLSSKPVKENHHCNISIISNDNEQHFQSPKEKVVASPSGFAKKTNGIKFPPTHSLQLSESDVCVCVCVLVCFQVGNVMGLSWDGKVGGVNSN